MKAQAPASRLVLGKGNVTVQWEGLLESVHVVLHNKVMVDLLSVLLPQKPGV